MTLPPWTYVLRERGTKLNQSRSRFVVLSTFVVAVLSSRAVHAETMVVSGVELRLPSEWQTRAKGPMTLLSPKNHKGRAVEVIALNAMPPATPEAFRSLLGGGEELALAAVKEADRDGTKIVVATGKVTTKKGEVAVDVLVVPVKDKAAMLVSFVGADQDPVIRKANIEILESARVPGPRISFSYTAPTRPGMVGPPKSVVEGISKIAGAFDKGLRLPRPLLIRFTECGMINAHYVNAKHMIEMCHELYDDFIVLFGGAGMDQAKAEETAQFAFVFTFLHEFGHALVGELALPITGKGEDAADEIATLILGHNPKSQKIALAGAMWFDIKTKKPGHQNIYWSTHSFDSVRMESVMCLLYGSDKAGLMPLMKQLKVPPKKLVKCERDTPLRLAAWKGMLKPYAVKK